MDKKHNLWQSVILHLQNASYPSQLSFHFTSRKCNKTTFFKEFAVDIRSVKRVPKANRTQLLLKKINVPRPEHRNIFVPVKRFLAVSNFLYYRLALEWLMEQRFSYSLLFDLRSVKRVP